MTEPSAPNPEKTDSPDEEPPEEILPEPIALPDLGFVLVQTPEQLLEAVEALTGSDVLGVDTESDSFFSYRESCCLLQVTGVDTQDFVIDPLALDDLSPLAPLFADPEVIKIFHGADYDVVSIKRDFGFEVRGIFDTMISAQASAHKRFGLNDLVQRYFGDKLNKKWQRHDWSSRPLTHEQLDYARRDSHYLPQLRLILIEQCEEWDRSEMLAEEFDLLEQREWSGREFHPDDCMRIKGSNKLDEDQRKVLRAVNKLREGIAKHKNRPPFKVWGNDICLKVAANPVKTLDELKKLLGDGNHVVRRYGREVVEAMKEGIADTSPAPNPPAPVSRRSKGVPPFLREDEPLLNHLKKWRNGESKSSGLGPGMVVNNHMLREVAALKPTSADQLSAIDDLRRWQQAAYGETLVEQVAAWKKKAPPAEGRKGRRRRGRRRGRRSGEGAGDDGQAGGSPSPEGGKSSGGDSGAN